MKKSFFWLLLLSSMTTFAQDKSIRGQVRDAQNEPVIGATVKLLALPDSSLVKGEAADVLGNFELKNLKTGQYFLTISAVSFQTYRSTPIAFAEGEKEKVLPLIVLQSSKIDLKEVVVVAKKPLIEQDIDKTIVNIESMMGASTSNSYEILSKAPGVLADENGGISLNGKNNVLVLIDGRPTQMSGQDLQNYLKSLPGGVIERLELIDNPSAKYDATGGAIINIVLKRNRKVGLTGNVNSEVSQGVLFRTAQSLSLNFNQRKINWFSTLSYSRGANIGDSQTERILNNNAPFHRNSVDNYYTFRNQSVFTRLGFDYYPNQKTIIGLAIWGMRIPRTESTELHSRYFDALDQEISYSIGQNEGRAAYLNGNANLNFQHKLRKEGNEWSGNFSYFKMGAQPHQAFVNSFSDQEAQRFDYRISNASEVYTFKTDLNLALPQNWRWESGLKAGWVNNDNDFQHLDIENGIEQLNLGRSNHFLYQENINAAYTNFRKNYARLGLQLGLRAENTHLQGHQLGNSEVPAQRFSQDFTNLFPSAFLSYKLDSLGKNTLTLNYTRRITRPSYAMFNPFLVFKDNNLYETGNPDLNPYYQSRVELSYQFRQFLNVRVAYQEATGMFLTGIRLQDDDFISQPFNQGSSSAFFVGLNVTKNLTKWWFINYNVQRLQSENRARINEQPLEIKATAYRANLVNQFTINPKISASLEFRYAGRDYIDGGFIRKSRNGFFVSIQHKVLKNQGTILLGGEDLFFQWLFRDYFITTTAAQINQTYRYDSRRVRLSFSYRFGNEKYTRKRRNNETGADELINRN